MATLDIRGAIVRETATAIKAPCLVATTGNNIALSGVQTIDGVLVGNNNERVLVKDQATSSQNGIYQATTGNWLLVPDFSSNTTVACGTLVLVTSGALNAGILFEQTCTDNPIVIGTSAIAFSPLAQNTAQAATSTTSLAIGTGSKTFTIQSGKAFVANHETTNTANAMLGQVTSYSGTSLVINVTSSGGSGTHADWSIVLTNSQAAAGIQPPGGNGNVTGPGSSTAGHVATFADGTGKVLQDGGTLVPAANTINASMLLQSAVAIGGTMFNGMIVAPTVGSGALTFAVKTLAGNDPSAGDPVWFVFRTNVSAGSGALSLVAVTASLSVTIPSGATLGSANNTPFRIWLAAVNNGGAVSLAVINCLSVTASVPNSICPLLASGFTNVSAFSGGANNSQIMYGPSSITNPPYSVIGYASYESGLTTAGTYASVPSRCDTWRPGMPLPGQVIQMAIMSTATTTTTGVASYVATAITQAIPLTSAANIVEATASTWENPAVAAATATIQIQRGGVVGLGQPITAGGGAAVEIPITISSVLDFPQVAGSTTYTVYCKGNGSNNVTIEGGNLSLKEIMS